MIPSTTQYKDTLHGPHERAVRIDITDINGVSRGSLTDVSQIITGEVSAVLTRRVTRVASFVLADEWFPRTADDPLSPEHAVVHISAGTRYGDGTRELFPVFTGRVRDADRNPDGSVTFGCDDLANDVIMFRFEQPRTTTQPTTLAEIRQLILEALPQATFGADDVTDQLTPVLVWDEDRGQALDDLSDSLGGRWYALGDGSFVVRDFNYVQGPILQTFADGPAGLLSQARTFRTRVGAANSVIVVSERTDGTDPVRVPARDTSPSSPTQFGGLFGRVSQIITVQTPLTTAQAQTLAQTQLSAAKALTEQWVASVVPDMTMEPGDTVALAYRGYGADQIIDTIVYPLDNKEPMQLGTRSAMGAI